jgi:hypothetical protein
MNFAEMGVPPGAVLQCTLREATVTVSDDTHVIYNGQPYSLTRVTELLTGYTVQPSPHWTFNGRRLRDIYEETYPRGDTN